MHQMIQSIVDVLIIIMASILAIFTVTLILLHLITLSNNKRMERIKQRILRMLSAAQDIEYLRGRIHDMLRPDSEIHSLRETRGIQSGHGTIALSMVVKEAGPEQKDRLREIILKDGWYLQQMSHNLQSHNDDRVGTFTKLIAELHLPGFEDTVYDNLHRWKESAEIQEISLLALFMCGEKDKLISLFSDPEFRLILSFRQVLELFSYYSGDHAELYRELLGLECDGYIIRSCIRGIGTEGLAELCPLAMPYLDSDNTNLIIDSIRTLGSLRYEPALERIREHTRHEVWSVRSAAVTSLAAISPDTCYPDLLRCLCDKAWWVRFHAAEALNTLPGHPELMDEVSALGDRYAFEMMRYIRERSEIFEKEAVA